MDYQKCIIYIALRVNDPCHFDPIIGAHSAAILIEHHLVQHQCTLRVSASQSGWDASCANSNTVYRNTPSSPDLQMQTALVQL